jgi:hypothetical protein
MSPSASVPRPALIRTPSGLSELSRQSSEDRDRERDTRDTARDIARDAARDRDRDAAAMQTVEYFAEMNAVAQVYIVFQYIILYPTYISTL